MLLFREIRMVGPIQRPHGPEDLPLSSLPGQLGESFQNQCWPSLLRGCEALAYHAKDFESTQI